MKISDYYITLFFYIYLWNTIQSQRTSVTLLHTAIPLNGCLTSTGPGLEGTLKVNTQIDGKYLDESMTGMIGIMNKHNATRAKRMESIWKQYGTNFDSFFRIVGMFLVNSGEVVHKPDPNKVIIDGLNSKVKLLKHFSNVENYRFHVAGEIHVRSSSHFTETYCPAIEVFRIQIGSDIVQHVFNKTMRIGVWQETLNQVSSFTPGNIKKGKKLPDKTDDGQSDSKDDGQGDSKNDGKGNSKDDGGKDKDKKSSDKDNSKDKDKKPTEPSSGFRSVHSWMVLFICAINIFIYMT